MKVIYAMIAASVLFTSCKKGGGDTAPVFPNPLELRIKTKGVGTSTITYEYDAQKRVIKSAGNGLTFFTVEYGVNTVTEHAYGSGGTISNTSNIQLNAQGLAGSVTKPQYPNLMINYEYNADKTVAKKTNYNNGTVTNITWYFYQDGNLVKDSTVNYPGLSYSSRTYEYYTDVISTTENVNWGLSHWGNSNKSPLKRVNYFSNGAFQQYQNYMPPELDAMKRIVKAGYQYNGVGAYNSETYTYL